MQTETQQKNHEQNRTARAEAIADVIVAFSKRTGIPAEELLRTAGSTEWHFYLRKSYESLPISGKLQDQPSDATKELVIAFVKRDARIPEHSKKNIHTQDSDCTLDPATSCCRVCGVDHSATCIKCSGRGFHLPSCPELADSGSESVVR